MKNKFLNYLIVALIITLPFERLFTFELFSQTVKISYLIGLIIISYFFATTRLQIRFQKEEIVILLFSLLSFLTFFWSIDPPRTLIISSVIFFMVLLFISLRRVIQKDQQNFYQDVFIYVGIAVSIFSFWQFFADSLGLSTNFSFLRANYTSMIFGFPRVQATFLEPLYFANFLIIPLFLAIFKVFRDKKLYLNYLPIFLISLAMFLTLSRGAFFAVGTGILICLFIVIIKFRQYLSKFIFSIVTIIIAIAVGSMMIWSVSGRDGVETYYGHASLDDATSGESVIDRASTITLALDSFRNNPFGIGAGAFGALPDFSLEKTGGSYQIVNNEYAEILSEQGFLGLFLFAIFILMIILQMIDRIKKREISAVFFLAIISALMIQYLTFSTLYIIYIWVFFGLIWPVKGERQISEA